MRIHGRGPEVSLTPQNAGKPSLEDMGFTKNILRHRDFSKGALHLLESSDLAVWVKSQVALASTMVTSSRSSPDPVNWRISACRLRMISSFGRSICSRTIWRTRSIPN
jgi:hypothetical protein